MGDRKSGDGEERVVSRIYEICPEADDLVELRRMVSITGPSYLDKCERELKAALNELLPKVVPSLRGKIREDILRRFHNVMRELKSKAEPRVDVKVVPEEALEGEELVAIVDNKSLVNLKVRLKAEGALKKEVEIDVPAGRSRSVSLGTPSKSGKVVVTWRAEGGGRELAGEAEAVVSPRPKEEQVAKPPEPAAPKPPPPPPAPPPQPSAAQPAPPPQRRQAGGGLDVGELLNLAARHALAAAVGLLAGRAIPEVRKVEKPVYVRDLPHFVEGGVTYILQRPTSVVWEDMGDYVVVRRASPSELMSLVTAKAARRLTDDFLTRVETILPGLRGGGKLDVKDLSEEVAEELAEEEAKRGRKVDAGELAGHLPRLFVAEVKYGGGLLRRPSAVVVAGCFSRLERLYWRGVDHEPAALREALEALGVKIEKDRLYIMASPTGWDPNSIEMARRMGNVALINLKTGEAYYGEGEIAEFVNALGYGVLPAVLDDKIVALDRQLLSGNISEEQYKAMARGL
ncbi:hypothetical protein [Pyrobaculum sp.]|uniref:hypothetical protein n=1 Tax=Pyrobaculum sp. TaxID=2004705 RepID=UPI003D0BB413